MWDLMLYISSNTPVSQRKEGWAEEVIYLWIYIEVFWWWNTNMGSYNRKMKKVFLISVLSISCFEHDILKLE